MATNITEAHRHAFEALTSGTYNNFALRPSRPPCASSPPTSPTAPRTPSRPKHRRTASPRLPSSPISRPSATLSADVSVQPTLTAALRTVSRPAALRHAAHMARREFDAQRLTSGVDDDVLGGRAAGNRRDHGERKRVLDSSVRAREKPSCTTKTAFGYFLPVGRRLAPPMGISWSHPNRQTTLIY